MDKSISDWLACVYDRGFLVFQSFGQHGRELITTELALRILEILSDEHSIPGIDNTSLSTMLDKLVIKVSFIL